MTYGLAIQKCCELERLIYNAKNILKLHYNIFSPDDERQQREYLQSKNYSIIKSLKYSFEIRRNEDKICGQFYDLIRNGQDLDSFKQIVVALQELVKASKTENQIEVASFAEKLMLHARTEEEVSYPTAILIGEYLKLKLK